MNTKNQSNQKGFTMIELIIVVAIMAIIGAVLVPMFSTMAIKARLTTDVTTVKTFQRQVDVYRAERGVFPLGFTTNAEAAIDDSVIQILVDENYIDKKDLSGGSLRLQSGGTLRVSGARAYLKASGDAEYQELVDKIVLNVKDGNNGWVYK